MSGESVQLTDPFKAHLIVLAGFFMHVSCNMQWGCMLGLLYNPSLSSVLTIKTRSTGITDHFEKLDQF